MWQWKTISIIYFECLFLTLGNQHAMRMGHIILSSVAFQVLQYFSTLSHKRHDFRKKKVFEHKLCFYFLHNFVWNISHSKKNWERQHKNVYWSSYNVPVILVIFLKKIEFSRHVFEKYSKIFKFHENMPSESRVVPCGGTDGQTDGRTNGKTDMANLIVASRNFATAPIQRK